MKVVIVNNVYNRFSTGKIVADLHRSLTERGYESYVCYARGPRIRERGVIKFSWDFYAKLNTLIGRITGILYGGCLISTIRLIRVLKRIGPDVVNLHCINDSSVNIYRLLRFLSSSGIKTIITLHSEFFYTGNCGHAYSCNKWKTGCYKCEQLNQLHTYVDNTRIAWKRMMKVFSLFDISDLFFTSVSPWLMSRAIQNPVLKPFKHFITLNGIEIESFTRKSVSLFDRLAVGISNKPLIMYVTSSFPSVAKGGGYILDLAYRMPEVEIIVLGDSTNAQKIPDNIKTLGRVFDRDQMAMFYSMADITVLVSKAETFSMPVAESLCCGTPVVGFEAGGPESICIKDYCKFVPYGDMDALIDAIYSILRQKYDKEAIMSKAKEVYSKERMTATYINVYNRALGYN